MPERTTMTADDLKRLGDKYHEWVRGGDGLPSLHEVIALRIIKGFYEGYGLATYDDEDVNPLCVAIFSALLDEIAEKEHGAYIVRRGRAKTFIQSQPEPPYGVTVWHWETRRITDFELLSEGETKLDALLAL